MDMLAELARIERDVMPELIYQPDRWWIKDFQFDKPGFHIRRLWAEVPNTPLGTTRIRLHQFEPYEADAMIHYHVWPMAAKILEGEYEMKVSYTRGNDEPPAMMKLMLQAGNTYEMTDQHVWHSVRPTRRTWSIMVFGPDFPENRGEPTGGGVTGFPVNREKVLKFMRFFERFFPRPGVGQQGLEP